MKAINSIVYACLASIVFMFTSCMNAEPDYGNEEDINQGEGKVSFASIKVAVDLGITASRAESIDTKNFIIRIYSTKTNLLVKEYMKLSEMPDIITLEVGDYRVEALSHELKAAEWSKPFYKGTQTFSIRKDEVTEIDNIKCTFQSIKVTVGYTDDLKTLLNENHSVTLSIGSGSLIFDDEKQVGYFAAQDVTNILIAKFQGEVDEEMQVKTKSFSNVKAGEYYNVVFDIDLPSIGDASLKLNLDASCYKISQTVVVMPGEDEILPEDPTGGNPGQSNVPTITGVGFDLADEVLLYDKETKSVVVNIKAQEGIQNLNVVIDSNTLTAEELAGINLAPQFDLAHPGSLEKGLKALGFPTGNEVIGKQSLNFDLTEFTPLLGALGSGTHNFHLTVIDALGNTKKATLTLITIVNNE